MAKNLIQRYDCNTKEEFFEIVINTLACGNFIDYKDYIKRIKHNKVLYRQYLTYIFDNYTKEQIKSCILESL